MSNYINNGTQGMITILSSDIMNTKYKELERLFKPINGYESKAYIDDEYRFVRLGNYYENKDLNDVLKMIQFKNINMFTKLFSKYLTDDEVLFSDIVQRYVREDIALYSDILKSKIFIKLINNSNGKYTMKDVDQCYEDFIYKTLLDNGSSIRYNFIFKNFKNIYRTNPLQFKYEKPENLPFVFGELQNSFITWGAFKKLPAYKIMQDRSYQYINGVNKDYDFRGYEIFSTNIVKDIIRHIVTEAREVIDIYDYTKIDRFGRMDYQLVLNPDIDAVHWSDEDGIVRDQNDRVLSTYPEYFKLI